MPANLRKAYKLSPKCLHPGNNKQSVPLALHIFHETTSAAIKSYFPEEIPAAEFLNLVNTWWTISNSKNIFNTSNRIGNAAIFNDKKPAFLRSLAQFISQWQNLSFTGCSRFTLSAQTANALQITLHGTADLIEDLLSDGYNYVLTSRLQTDPLEKHFGKLRQMSGGRFLVSLREVESSLKILSIKSLIKENLNCWMEDVQPDSTIKADRSEIITSLSLIHNEIEENELCDESREVAINVAGYVTRKIMNKVDCANCLEILQSNK